MIFNKQLGIFEKHKLLFSFQITSKLQIDANILTLTEINFFIKGNSSIEKAKQQNPLPEWLPDSSWQDLICLIQTWPHLFGNLVTDLTSNNEEWKEVRKTNLYQYINDDKRS